MNSGQLMGLIDGRRDNRPNLESVRVSASPSAELSTFYNTVAKYILLS